MHHRVDDFGFFMLLAKKESPCHYGQPELTYRPILNLYYVTGEIPQETRKLVRHEQIEHWRKFGASEFLNEFGIHEHF